MPMVPYIFVPLLPEAENRTPPESACSKAVLASNREYASSEAEGQGDAAAYQTRWHRLRLGQDRPRQCQ